MKMLLLAGCTILIAALSSCGPAEEQNTTPADTSPPAANQLDGNTAPADRDPTPQSGTGGTVPTDGQKPPR